MVRRGLTRFWFISTKAVTPLGLSDDKSCYLTTHRDIILLCDDYKSCKRNMSAFNSNCADTVVFRSGKSVKRYFLALSCTVLVPNHFFCYGPYIQQPRVSSSPSTDSFIQLYKHIPVQKPPLAFLERYYSQALLQLSIWIQYIAEFLSLTSPPALCWPIRFPSFHFPVPLLLPCIFQFSLSNLSFCCQVSALQIFLQLLAGW